MICCLEGCETRARGWATPIKETIVQRGAVAGQEFVMPLCEADLGRATKIGMKINLFGLSKYERAVQSGRVKPTKGGGESDG